MLGLGAFGRKPRSFEYKPRHFDPEKEAREERRKELRGEDADDQHDDHDTEKETYRPGQYIRKSMYARRGLGTSRQDKDKRNTKIIRVVLVALFILLLMLWLVEW